MLISLPSNRWTAEASDFVQTVGIIWQLLMIILGFIFSLYLYQVVIDLVSMFISMAANDLY